MDLACILLLLDSILEGSGVVNQDIRKDLTFLKFRVCHICSVLQISRVVFNLYLRPEAGTWRWDPEG